jgi:signal transduction histidine kinase
MSLTPTPPRPTFISAGPIFATVAATLPGFAQGAMGRSREEIAVLAGAVLVSLALGTFGLRWAERQPANGPLYAVMGLYGAGVLTAIWITDSNAFLVAMPLTSVLVLYLPMRVAIALTLVLAGWVSATIARVVDDPGVLASASLGTASAFAFVLVFSTIVRRERYARRDLALMSAELEVLATHRERNRIAREIHDSLGHCLTVANVQLEAARTVPEGRDERLVRVQQLLKDGLGELRRSVSLLREGPLPPFTHAIAELVAECNDTGLSAELSTHGVERSVAGSVGFTLYRATQEALTNVRRHANAKKVAVALDYRPATVTLRVSDDGVGAAATSNEGNGLIGLRERVELAGGTVKVEKPAAGGFAVIVEVPG